MKTGELSDRWEDEAHIVFKWYASLLKKSEVEAYMNLVVECKASAEKSGKTAALLRTAKDTKKETIRELKDGSKAFLKKTLLRVLNEHGKDLIRCPRCRLICAPGAIVCEHCYLLLKE